MLAQRKEDGSRGGGIKGTKTIREVSQTEGYGGLWCLQPEGKGRSGNRPPETWGLVLQH